MVNANSAMTNKELDEDSFCSDDIFKEHNEELVKEGLKKFEQVKEK